MQRKSLIFAALVIVIVLLSVSVQPGIGVHASADDPDPQTGATPPVTLPESNPPPSVRSEAGMAWDDGEVWYSTLPYSGVATWVGFYHDLSLANPSVNAVYYIHVMAYGITCVNDSTPIGGICQDVYLTFFYLLILLWPSVQLTRFIVTGERALPLISR